MAHIYNRAGDVCQTINSKIRNHTQPVKIKD